MDSFELNKIMGAVLATCLGVLSINMAAGAIFAPGKLEKPGYAIAVPDQPAAGAETAKAEPAEPIAVRLASSDVGKGQAAAKQCAACHTFEKGGPNRVGPNLYGIVDRAKASHEGFNYSAAMKAKGGTWTYDDLDHFLAGPKAWLPGTSMGYAGLTRGGQRADLINYLHTLSDNPVPLPKAADATPAEKK
jgi:cytochrome c